MDGRELTALYTLQHGLARDAEKSGGFEHRHMVLWHCGNKAGPDLLIDADAPWRTRSDLFAGNESIGKPAMYGGRGGAKDFCSPFNRN